jgi:hypothetical protein
MSEKSPNYFVLLSGALLLIACSGQSQPRRATDVSVQAHVRQVVQSLPPDSSLRRTLEGGHLGDGVHEPWMDEMKRVGVKQAMFEVHGVWRDFLGFRPQDIRRTVYRKDYDGANSQITSENDLAKIRQTGLEQKLHDAAFEKAKMATWRGVDSPPKWGEKCFVNIYLFYDEWLNDAELLTDSPGIGRYNPEDFPLNSAAAVGDKLTLASLLATKQFPKDDLNAALFNAVKYPSNNTDVISLLLKAGADVNVQRSDGTTPLMDAVARLNLSNIKLLLSSGADVSRKTTIGWTAYSLALQEIKQFRENDARPPEYMPEMLKLLKPASSVL